MKFFVQIIIILVVVNFTTTGFVLAQSASEKAPEGTDSEVIENARRFSEAAGQQERETVAEVVAAAQKKAEAAAKEAQEQADVLLKQAQVVQEQVDATAHLRDLLVELAPESKKKLSRNGGDRILVIPTSQMKPEDLVAIMEDMSIMSRIFDKKVSHVSPPSVPMLGEIPMIGHLFSRSGRATEGVYLQGFGAIFFMGVNFPLSPPLEVKEQTTEEVVDPVWTQTKREMYTQEEGKRMVGIETIHNGETLLLGGMVAKYDAEKVDEFKRAVTKTLKHAANIRNLKPEEWVVVTVTGAIQPVVIEQKVEQVGQAGKEVSRIIRITPHVSKARSCSTILTLRVRKSDIDSYSNGELDFDKFRQKIVIFTYPYLSGAAGSESTRLLQVLPPGFG